MRRRLPVVIVALLGMLLPLGPTGRAAAEVLPGAIVAYGTLSAPGLTIIPSGTVPDLSQWQTWPGRSWQIQAGTCVSYRPYFSTYTLGNPPSPLCGLSLSGFMAGWCDLSKAQGSGGYWTTGWTSQGGTITSFHWTGIGNTLAVTGEIETYEWDELPLNGYLRGTLSGTVTLLKGTGGATLDPCADPNGLQSPIPVLIELQYVLQ